MDDIFQELRQRSTKKKNKLRVFLCRSFGRFFEPCNCILTVMFLQKFAKTIRTILVQSLVRVGNGIAENDSKPINSYDQLAVESKRRKNFTVPTGNRAL